MSFKFRPLLNVLEGREVPASFSFALPTGGAVSGQFSEPSGVDADEEFQNLALADLTVRVGSATFGPGSFSTGPTANYSHGVLQGVSFVLTSPPAGYDYLSVGVDEPGAVVVVGGELFAQPVAYDGADTEVTFTLPDGTTGSISYQIPWDQINWTQPSQMLSLTSFNLNIAGRNFVYGTADFTASPVLNLANGDIVGLDFSVNTPGTPYLNIAFANGTITALTGPGQFISAPAPVPQMPAPKQEVTFNFSPVTTGKDYVIDLTFKNDDGRTLASISIDVSKTDGTDDIGNKLALEINKGNVFVATYTGKALVIKPAVKGNGRTWSALNYSVETPNGAADPTLAGPATSSTQNVTVTGQLTQP